MYFKKNENDKFNLNNDWVFLCSVCPCIGNKIVEGWLI